MTIRFLSRGKVDSDHLGSEEGNRREKAGWPRKGKSWEASPKKGKRWLRQGWARPLGGTSETPRVLKPVPHAHRRVGVAGYPHFCDELGKQFTTKILF